MKAIESPDEALEGFPVSVRLSGGESLTLDLPEPGVLGQFDETHVGLALVDAAGFVRRTWGLGRDVPYFRAVGSLTETPLARLVGGAWRGIGGSLHLDDLRYYAAPIRSNGSDAVLLLVVDARDEGRARKDASLNERKADALKRLGKALTMNQTLEPMAVAAVHAINSAGELAAVLLWVRTSDEDEMALVASVGANRAGIAVLSELDTQKGVSCAAELAAVRQEPLVLRRVDDNPVTADLEGKFCYLKPGGLMVFPLVVGGKLVGLLEVIARQDDETFLEAQELFATIAEHLALALNSAIMFENVERLAAYDPLTGIANHRTMQEFLLKRVIEAQRNETTLGVIMVDVDHFRSFNEEEGHDAGDKVLRMVADVLKATVRPYDLAARYGGEEFTVVMPGAGVETTLAVAERIRASIEKLELVASSGRVRHVTASLGCAVFPMNATESATVLKAADTALYEAKRSGRNRTVMFEGEFTDGSARTERLLTAAKDHLPEDMREASLSYLSECRPFILHLAAEIGLSDGQVEILGAACLLVPAWWRWQRTSDEAALEALRKDSEMRAVAPCLADLSERFDGTGPRGLAGERIPLLPRVLSAIVAMTLERGIPFQSDPGRFDPSLVSAIGGFETAA